jgi:hypothetical protein
MKKNSKRQDPDFSYVNEKGKWVHASAAFMHEVYTNCGSVQEYNDTVGEKYIKGFLKFFSAPIQKELEKDHKRKMFKKIG